MGIVKSIELISVSATGEQGNSASFQHVFSPDGNRIAFVNSASNLVAGDTNGEWDIFVKDLITGAIQRVSTSATGGQGNNTSSSPVFSPDGTKVAFASNASNLVNGDTNAATDVFIKDLATGAIQIVSISQHGLQGNGSSGDPVFSPDGTKVAFQGLANNFVSGDFGHGDIFVKDLITGAIQRINTSTTGQSANGDSGDQVFSPDGTKVAFMSNASTLLDEGDTNGKTDVFVKDLTTGAIQLVSASATGEQSNDFSQNPVFSPDGNQVAFFSGASNLVAGDTNGVPDIFIKNLITGAIQRVSISATGAEGNGHSYSPVFSPDGTKLAFRSNASNLVDGDTNDLSDIFVKDLLTGSIERVSISATGEQSTNHSNDPVFSPDGNRLAFQGYDGGLVAGDTNGHPDVFVVTLEFPQTIAGGQGADTLIGGVADDEINGFHGHDVIEGRAGNDTLTGWTGDDTISGEAGNDSILGGSGHDVMFCGTGDDYASGYAGNDSIEAGEGNDTLLGGDGNDYLHGFTGHDSIEAGEGNDTIHSGEGDDTAHGKGGNDLIQAGSGDDVLKGGDGLDTLSGGNGNDTLTGGLGKDVLAGGADNDVFVFLSRAESTETAFDRIKDFEVGHDRIDLSGLGYSGISTAATVETGELRLIYSASSDRTYLRDDYSAFEMALEGANYTATLTNADFMF